MGTAMKTRSNFVLASNGHCFFCLSQIMELESEPDLPSPPVKQISSLQYLTRYLKMDLRKVFTDKVQVSTELLEKIGNAKLKVELCGECHSLSERFSKVYRQLEKLELELGSTLSLIHRKLVCAVPTEELPGLTSGLNSKWNGLLEVLDVLRADAIQKSSHKLSKTPRVKIPHLTQTEVKAKQSMLKKEEDSSQSAANAEVGSHCGLETSDVKMEPETLTQDSLSKHAHGNYFSDDATSNLKSEPMNRYVEIERDLNADENSVPEKAKRSAKKVISRTTRNVVGTGKRGIDPDTGKLECNDCSKKFKSGTALTLHYQTVHLKLRYKCISCKKLFSQKSHLRVHRSTSRSCSVTEPKFNCHLCKKSFSLKHHLKEHLEGVHHKLQKYECKLCKKKFNVKTYLTTHFRKSHRMGKIHDQ